MPTHIWRAEGQPFVDTSRFSINFDMLGGSHTEQFLNDCHSHLDTPILIEKNHGSISRYLKCIPIVF